MAESTNSDSDENPFTTLLSQPNLTAKLAVLQPAKEWDALIELTLTEVLLKDTSYECISYDRSSKTASAANNIVAIKLDGEDYDIPKQLESALRAFRRKERTRILWADVLAGRTPEERNAQTDVQRQILEKADRTLCWLGPEKSDSMALAFETITEMGRRFTDACRQVGLGPNDRITRATMQQMAGIRDRLVNCAFDDLHSFNFKLWREIGNVFGAPYWGSVQAVSDIVLARCPIVVQGRGSIHWHTYIAAGRAMPLFNTKFFGVPLLPHVHKGLEVANELEIAEFRRRVGESVELMPMVQTARMCEPLDSRETVFSMLLIATPSARIRYHKMGPRPLPTVDHTMTPEQIFIEVARYSILERQDLMLWFADRPPCAKRLKGLPSWVPDYSAIPPKVGTLFNPNAGMRAWWGPGGPERPIAISEDNKLHLQARPLDRIVHVSHVFNAGNARRLCLSEFQKLPPDLSPSESPAQVAERFWRTLILNAGGTKPGTASFRETAVPAVSFGVHFDSLLAEEAMFKALDCTMTDLQTPENAERIRSSPELLALVPRCGKAQPYEDILVKHAAGRRFFRTATGRFGMTAIEDVVAADNDIKDEDSGLELPGDSASMVANARGADLGRRMRDPLGRMMMQDFQRYLNERDPERARAAAKAMRGIIPGINEDEQVRTDSGVREGDIVVACVGGFFPYVFRPHARPEEETREEPEEDSSEYEFVGECYLHKAMDGEDFQSRNIFGQKYLRIDPSQIVDITIV
ncbi:uncharacterized protein F4822DRAFT_412873 [Hypoxylon trugodes]|uniref:uncharacterized protein n=1 Tax=Hypoxylon trugodes TaxID=326681 RepID=UPI00218D0F71|nr:uncharacterized protein F4822DRAFT_412873 [Hypoxylon trugodes]KAI1385370.1 hypothetical protein F4822DRAFT_412873 [Hypoxylon trugodes]